MEKIDLHAAAAQKIEEIAEQTRKKLASSREDIARFQALCDALHARGLQFAPSINPCERRMFFWIHTDRKAAPGELMLALANLGCEGKELDDYMFEGSVFCVTGPAIPEFNLHIRPDYDQPDLPGEPCHGTDSANNDGGPGWAAVTAGNAIPECGDPATGQPCRNESAEACGECLALITESEARHAS